MDHTLEGGLATEYLAPEQREQLRERLVIDRASATELIDMLKATMDSFNFSQRGIIADDEHDPEGPSIAVQRSEANALLAQSRHHLDEINEAMLRLETGGYGVCENCKREIPFARLEARPHARYCISCAERLTR